MRHLLPLPALVAVLMAVPAAVGAQTVTGVVRDTTGRPLPNTAVALDPEGSIRGTRTDAQGRFRFERVTPGAHSLRTTRIGFRPDDRTIDVPSGGVSVEIVLVPVPARLDTLAIVARRTGVVGTVIAGTSFGPLARGAVEVLGTRWRASTGADGRFEFAELLPGAYSVSVRRDGYRSRMISAVVPDSGAVEIAAVLDTLTTSTDQRREVLLREMASRLTRRARNDVVVVAHHELLADGGEVLLDDALRYAPSVIAKGIIVIQEQVCALFVGGKQDNFLRLEDFEAEDVAMVEVYRLTRCVTWVKDPEGQLRPVTRAGGAGVNVYVWLKR